VVIDVSGSSDAATASSSAVAASVQSDTVPATTRSCSSSVGVRRGRGRGRTTVQATRDPPQQADRSHGPWKVKTNDSEKIQVAAGLQSD